MYFAPPPTHGHRIFLFHEGENRTACRHQRPLCPLCSLTPLASAHDALRYERYETLHVCVCVCVGVYTNSGMFSLRLEPFSAKLVLLASSFQLHRRIAMFFSYSSSARATSKGHRGEGTKRAAPCFLECNISHWRMLVELQRK